MIYYRIKKTGFRFNTLHHSETTADSWCFIAGTISHIPFRKCQSICARISQIYIAERDRRTSIFRFECNRFTVSSQRSLSCTSLDTFTIRNRNLTTGRHTSSFICRSNSFDSRCLMIFLNNRSAKYINITQTGFTMVGIIQTTFRIDFIEVIFTIVIIKNLITCTSKTNVYHFFISNFLTRQFKINTCSQSVDQFINQLFVIIRNRFINSTICGIKHLPVYSCGILCNQSCSETNGCKVPGRKLNLHCHIRTAISVHIQTIDRTYDSSLAHTYYRSTTRITVQ